MKVSRFCVVSFLGVVVLLSFVRIVHARQDAPAVNADAILRDLKKIEENQEQGEQAARARTIAELKTAAASGVAAANFYEKAMEATQFEGMQNKGGAYADWKRSKADMLRSNEAQTALLLHLKYLLLSLQRKASDKPELFVQPALAYARELAASDPLFLKQAKSIQEKSGDKDDLAVHKEAAKLKDALLNKPLTAGVFVEWLRLKPWLPKSEEWELVPGNLPGILEKDVRTVLRKEKNPQLLATWEMETQFLADRVTFSRLEHETVEFNAVTRPRLRYSRAQDMLELGQRNRAITEIYALVKAYPQHPDFDKWVQNLRELLTPKAESETPKAEG